MSPFAPSLCRPVTTSSVMSGGVQPYAGASRGACDMVAHLHGLLHGVVDVEDDALRTIFAMGLLVLACDDGECLLNVVHVVTPDAVEVEVGRSSLRRKGIAFNTQERVILK